MAEIKFACLYSRMGSGCLPHGTPSKDTTHLCRPFSSYKKTEILHPLACALRFRTARSSKALLTE
jgi:hypothetical protein